MFIRQTLMIDSMFCIDITSYAQLKREPTAQTAHFVFAESNADAKKTKRAVFSQRYE